MKLKAHLNFIGDRKTETISVNKPGYPYEILEIEVDNYDKIWEYLNILSEHQNTLLIKKWREKYNVNSQELNGLNEFLRDNYLVYDKIDFEENSSTRVLNFINNFVNSNNRYDTLKKIKNDDLSDFNIVLNTNLLFEEKTPFLYPKAYILAFKLVSMFTKDPSIFFKFVNYLSNPIEKITVNNLLKHLNISLSKKSFDEITSEFISYLNFLMNQEKNENIV